MEEKVVVGLEGHGSPIGDYHLPIVTVRMRRSGAAEWKFFVRGLIDTGAAYTIMLESHALACGIGATEISSAPPVTIVPVGGKEITCRAVRMDLKLGPPKGGKSLTLVNTPVCVSKVPLADHDVLIGQVGGLDRLVFAHIAQQPWPRFVVRFPVTATPTSPVPG